MQTVSSIESAASLRELEFTDLYLTEDGARVRIQGKLLNLEPTYRPEADALFDKCIELYDTAGPEFSVKHDEATYRCVMFPIRKGHHISLRKLSNKIFTWRELRLPHVLLDLMLPKSGKHLLKRGLILVVGETDSGKSTTINALIDEISNKESWLTITLEDPVEVSFEDREYPTGAQVVQREMLSDEFPEGLKQALRANADVIKIGEIRDASSARVSLDAAISGHLVLATLHAGSIIEGLTRLSKLLGEGGNVLISTALRSCLHQELSLGAGFITRTMNLSCLLKTKAVQNIILEGNFAGLRQIIDLQTQQHCNGGRPAMGQYD